MLPLFYSDAQTTIVSLVVGNLVNWLLHGTLTVQLYLYYLAFPNDRKWTKAAVYTVYILETVQAIGLGIILVVFIVSNNPESASFFSYSNATMYSRARLAQPFLAALVGGLVPLIAQCIYAHRIRIITRRKVMSTIIIILAILQLFAAIASAPLSATFLILSAGLNVVNDLIIAFIMVRSLSKNKCLSDYTRLKVIRLVHLIIATGSLTVAANILSLVSLAFSYPYKGDLIAMPVVVFMPKLYANSILVMLNNRMAIRDSRNATSNMMSTNVVSMLVIADHQTRPPGSAMSRDEESFSSPATTPAI